MHRLVIDLCYFSEAQVNSKEPCYLFLALQSFVAEARFPLKSRHRHRARVSSPRFSLPGPAVPVLRRGPAAAAPGAGGAASLQRGQVGPGEGELGAVSCEGPVLTQEANLKRMGVVDSVLELFENVDAFH